MWINKHRGITASFSMSRMWYWLIGPIHCSNISSSVINLLPASRDRSNNSLRKCHQTGFYAILISLETVNNSKDMFDSIEDIQIQMRRDKSVWMLNCGKEWILCEIQDPIFHFNSCWKDYSQLSFVSDYRKLILWCLTL